MASCPIFRCIMGVVVLGFFALSAYNVIQDLETNSTKFAGKYKTFQTRVENMSGYTFHQHIHHDKVSEFAETILLYVSYVSLAFCAIAMLKPCAGVIPAFLWLVSQVLEHEFLELSQNRNLKQIEVVAMTLAVYISALFVFCSGPKKSCCAKKGSGSQKANSSVKTPSVKSKKNKRKR